MKKTNLGRTLIFLWRLSAKSLVLLFLTSCTALYSRTLELYVDAPARTSAVATTEVSIPMRDSTSLRAMLFVPKNKARSDTILVRAPLPETTKVNLFVRAVGGLWSSRGYAVLISGTRGYFGSEGAQKPFLKEREDGLDTLAWLRSQEFYNGSVHTWGGSYFGYTQMQLGDQPDVKSQFIHIAARDWKTLFDQNGIFEFQNAFYWAWREAYGDTPDKTAIYRYAKQPELLEETARELPLFHAWRDGDGYWESRESMPELWQQQAPILSMAGWYDPFIKAQLADFAALQAQAPSDVAQRSKMLIGPWTHAGEATLPESGEKLDYRFASIEPMLPWLESHKTKPSAPYTVFVLGENRWREFNEWPPAGLVEKTLWLGEKSLLSEAQPPKGSCVCAGPYHDPKRPLVIKGGAALGNDAGIHLQNEAFDREDTIVFFSEPLTKDLVLLGQASLEARLAPTSLPADYYFTLLDVFPNGRAYNVTQAVVHAEDERSYKLRFRPIARQFRTGHRIGLLVSSSYLPHFELNTQSGQQGICTAKCSRSVLSLPVFASNSEAN